MGSTFLVAACLSSSACTFIQTLPSSMSIVWFPAHLRNLATSLAVLSYGAGCALGFFVGSRALRSLHTQSHTLYSRTVHANTRLLRGIAGLALGV